MWVAEGTFYPSDVNGYGYTNVASPSEERELHFSMRNNVSIYGGFPDTETATVLTDRDYEIYQTILSGEIGNELTIADNCYHVLLSSFRQRENTAGDVDLDIFGGSWTVLQLPEPTRMAVISIRITAEVSLTAEAV